MIVRHENGTTIIIDVYEPEPISESERPWLKRVLISAAIIAIGIGILLALAGVHAPQI